MVNKDLGNLSSAQLGNKRICTDHFPHNDFVVKSNGNRAILKNMIFLLMSHLRENCQTIVKIELIFHCLTSHKAMILLRLARVRLAIQYQILISPVLLKTSIV